MNVMILNFCLNKFMPTIMIAFLAFYKLGFNTIEPYGIMVLLFFSQHFHYKSGYSVAYCESRGIKTD